MEVTPEFLKAQLDCIFTDIRPDAVKTGMVSASALIEVIAERLRFYGAENLVVDPVMVATSGARLISEDAIGTLKKELLPLAKVITPNIPEAEVLSGRTVASEKDMEAAAKEIYEKYGCGVLCKGGHSINDANDVLFSAESGEAVWFKGRRIDNPNTHGTGCTLSSAIASNLAKGCSLTESVERAKAYLSGALEAMLDLGKGSGPLMHNYALPEEFIREV
jgi:hydroxymethylpyrimidine/phosphomethylpyrimidine kinase